MPFPLVSWQQATFDVSRGEKRTETEQLSVTFLETVASIGATAYFSNSSGLLIGRAEKPQRERKTRAKKKRKNNLLTPVSTSGTEEGAEEIFPAQECNAPFGSLNQKPVY